MKFRENMVDIVNDLASTDSNYMLLGEARAYLVYWIFFEFFIVFREDHDHLLTIRNYFYKYIFETDLESFEMFRRKNLEEYRDEIPISTQLTKLKFLIRICDFQEMQKYLENLRHILKEESEYSYPGTHQDFAEIFELLLIISKNYNEVISEEYGVNGESKRIDIFKNIQKASGDIEEILNSIMDYTRGAKLNSTYLNCIHELVQEVDLIRRIFTGDIDGIKFICENYKEWILMSIYYRFHQPYYLETTRDHLNDYYEPENIIDKDLISILVLSPFELYQSIKNRIPKWLQFHMMDILFDLDYLPKADSLIIGGRSLRDYYYVEFLNHLMILEIGIEDFLNYSSLYDYNEKEGPFLVFLEKIVIMNVLKEFRRFVKKSELKSFLNNLLHTLLSMREANFLINSVTKICFDRFFEKGMYKNAVELYYSYDLRSASAHAREDIFEKIFYEILIKDELRLSEEIIKISKLKLVQNIPKFEFINRLINASQILSEEKTKFSYDLLIQIKEFFNFCFVQENCPKSMWLWTLNLFRVKHKENIENFREIKYQDYKSVFGNHSGNEERIKRELRKFFLSNRGCKKFQNQTEEQNQELVYKEFYTLNQFLFDCQIYSYTK